MMCSSRKRRIHGPISNRLSMSSPGICIVQKTEACSVAVPGDHPVNGCGVTKIMQPWWIAGSFVALNACALPYTLKERDDMLIGQGAAGTRCEERRIV